MENQNNQRHAPNPSGMTSISPETSPPHQQAPTAPMNHSSQSQSYQHGNNHENGVPSTHVVQPHQSTSKNPPNIIFSVGKYIPCLFIFAVIGWSWYAMVMQVIGWYYLQNYGTIVFIALLVVYHIILILFIWSWAKTVLTQPWTADERYELTDEEASEYYKLQASGTPEDRNSLLKEIIESRGLTVCQRQDLRGGQRRSREAISDEIRFCRKTNAIKPDRAHYDSMTKKLVLKMDHYCPWVANCIGFNNYKFFVLFLFYAISYCFTIIGITLKPFLTVWTNQGQNDPNQPITSSQPTNEPAAFRMQTILVFMVASVFSLSIFFLFSFHCYLVSKNRTTIEVYGAPTIRNVGPFKNAYNVGCFKNWQQVMGNSMLMWPIPVAYAPRDCDGGHSYPLAEILGTNQQIDVV